MTVAFSKGNGSPGTDSLEKGTHLQSLKNTGNFLAVQWLGLCTSLQGARVRSLVAELGSQMPCGAAKKKKKNLKKQRKGNSACHKDGVQAKLTIP